MPAIGQLAPYFEAEAVVDGGKFKDIKLDDYKGKWLVLYSYPLDFTFVCPTEITQFRDYLPEFKKLKAEVVGFSVNSVHSHKRWIQDDLKDLGYPLLGDIKKEVSRDYGVLLHDAGVATRATFIIDPEQKIQYMGIHNLDIGRDCAEIIRVLSGLQTGELCGAGWKSGDNHVVAK